MTVCERFYAAACQLDMPNLRSREEIPGRVDRLLERIDYAVEAYEPFCDVRLVVFPEFAHAAPVYPTLEELHDRLAVPIPNEHTDRYRQKARQRGIYIQTGTFLESDARWPGCVFNATCLIGPDGILSKYRKVHPWLPWELSASPHDLDGYGEPLFPVAETEIGRIGAAICYDWLFPEAIRQLALGGAEVLARVSAYMDPWGTAAPLEWWTLVNRVRAIENMAYVVAANQAAGLERYPPFSWPGGSMIVDYDGRVLSQVEPGPGDRTVVGPIDLAALRAERDRRRGHHLLAHLRTEAYPLYRQPIYPAGGIRGGSHSTAANEDATRRARDALGRMRGGHLPAGGRGSRG
ncbi:MAG: nitrilase-related carbon-nitrogen hydrolase [Thermoguttaceae bacterium]|jgi:predicted amidohydrolase